ncbi:MAG: hypothetical protein U0169_23980 [Polyangiaceae bacterium]
MGLRIWNGLILGAMAMMWVASGAQREKPVLSAAASGHVPGLEAELARGPQDSRAVRDLAQAYLEAKAPGFAQRTVEAAPASVRADAEVEHVYARALLEQGRAADALAAERDVLATCANDGCETRLVVLATRRAAILEELVRLGVEDAAAYPEVTQIAYQNATRQARLARID